MPTFLRDFARTIQFADLVDVLLVTAFFFVGISWLRRSSSGSAARRITALGLLLAIVYMLADLVHLFLVRQVLQLLLLVFLVAAVVVFQADIRRLLDRIGSWGESSPAGLGGGATVETLLEVANRLADDRIGAIIALRGRDSWESHVQGGVELDGRVSRPLLESIFQPESAGHDGAVLMEGDRVVRFAAHLPLAAHIPEVSRYGGTRHAAALGLADETDAFVLVISEERGSISVAEQGRLTEIESLSVLAGRLSAFWDRHYGEAAARGERWWSRSTLETLGMAAGVASVIWLLFSYSADTISRTFDVPIEFRNLPPEWALESDTVPSALVTLTGSERAFGRLDATELAISFDLTEPDSGLNVLTVSGEHLALPSGLRLANVNPQEVRVEAYRQVAVELPIQIRTLQPVPDSFSLVPQPRTVTILLNQDAEAPARIRTMPIDLERLIPDGTVRASLDIPSGARLPPEEPTEVTVALRRAGVSPAR
jgi:diadenylate cyclase